MNKDQAKEEIKKLIAKYEQVKSSGKVKSYTEESTKKDFILPLFKALGWNVEEDEVSAEEHIISSGRVDYGFYINNRPKFYLEAKPLKADLNLEEFAKQAIRYSLNRGVTWAVLTDFEGIKVFNAQALSNYLGDKLYFELSYSEYLSRFDKLWELSKESFQSGIIDKNAQEVGKKLPRTPITELLYKDLNECRKLLTDKLGQWNPSVPQNLLDEGVQKLLDRIVFIKVAENRGIEDNVFLPLINQWRVLTGPNKPTLYQSMTRKFRELDSIYNSSLFSEHPFEKWEEEGDALGKVLKILNGKEGYYEYDFSVMPADVLGTVYENYLGYKLSQSAKGLKLHKDAEKRKEQGIYYTPTFIVDYIVRNALKPVLDNCKSVSDLKKIKVLDPACGSGSFLIKALEVIVEKYKDFSVEVSDFTKFEILQENIFGVDLDAQAVEITKLNLLINSFQQREILPSLDNNIKNGNSLISGTDEELEKYFGQDFRDKKPFNWEEEFPEVFKQGGFNVIVGNPPYVAITGIDYDSRRIYEKMYQTAVGRFDLFVLFIEKSITLLREDGALGLIIPNKFLVNNQSQKSREFILRNGKVASILFINERVFSAASVNSIVIIFEKTIKNISCTINEYEKDRVVKLSEMSNEIFLNDPEKRFIIDEGEESKPLLKKITQDSVKLEEIAEVRDGIVAGRIKHLLFYKEKINSSCKPLLFGNDINRYQKHFSNNYVDYRIDVMKKYEIEKTGAQNIGLRMRYKDLYKRPKILTRKTADKIIAAFDDENYYYEQTLHSTYIKDKDYLPLYILTLLNSNIFKFYYQSFVKQSGTIFPQVRISLLKSLPIKKLALIKQKEIAKKAEILAELYKKLSDEQENSNKWNSLKEEIEKMDKKIDEEVYKLYGLTPEEIKIVENS